MDNNDDDNDDDEFLFESSHLALRGNPDYLKVMKHLAVLCSSRIQVQRDIDLLRLQNNKARDRPIEFVEKLRKGSLDLPPSIVVPEIPIIDFTKYDFDIKDKYRETTETTNKPSTSQDKNQQGIVYWTLEEQRKLEELLNEFPPEPIESQRYAKIAKAMGNRTQKQIASRVQKFFKKLHEANLPIPGSSSCRPLARRHNRSQRQKFKLERPTTFFPERIIPSDLMMKDDCDDDTDEFPQIEKRSSKEYQDNDSKVVHFLKLVRAEKERCSVQTSSTVSGINCSSCDKSLLVGSRWLCHNCEGVSFCGDCLVFQLLNKSFLHLHHEVDQR